jgi:integrase
VNRRHSFGATRERQRCGLLDPVSPPVSSQRLLAGAGVLSLRATVTINALDHQADIAKVQEWLGHANIATTRIYDHRKTNPEDSPKFKVTY